MTNEIHYFPWNMVLEAELWVLHHSFFVIYSKLTLNLKKNQRNSFMHILLVDVHSRAMICGFRHCLFEVNIHDISHRSDMLASFALRLITRYNYFEKNILRYIFTNLWYRAPSNHVCTCVILTFLIRNDIPWPQIKFSCIFLPSSLLFNA